MADRAPRGAPPRRVASQRSGQGASTLVATGCLTLLSVWHAADGRAVTAWAFLALALGNLAFGRWRARQAAAGTAPPRPVTPGEAAGALPAQRRARANWLAITVLGWAGTLAFAVPAPLPALLLAAVSVYSSQRYVRTGRTLRALQASAGQDI